MTDYLTVTQIDKDPFVNVLLIHAGNLSLKPGLQTRLKTGEKSSEEFNV